MTRRAEQAASVIHRAVQTVLTEGLSDPRLQVVMTVTGVKVTPDMRTAIIGVSVMPGEKGPLALHGLRAASRHIRRRVGDAVSVHQLPDLVFKLDESLKRQAEVISILAEVSRELSSPNPPAESDPAPHDEQTLKTEHES